MDEDLSILASILEEWADPRPGWEVLLYEGTEFGRTNNVKARVLFVAGEHTSRLLFRLDQLERTDDTGEQLVLSFEERAGIAKLARLQPTGLDVELFHILTFT